MDDPYGWVRRCSPSSRGWCVCRRTRRNWTVAQIRRTLGDYAARTRDDTLRRSVLCAMSQMIPAPHARVIPCNPCQRFISEIVSRPGPAGSDQVLQRKPSEESRA
jgi:hypothetical protein